MVDKYMINLNEYVLYWFDGYAHVLRDDVPAAPDYVIHWFCEGCLYGFEATSDFLLPRKRIDLSIPPPEQTSGPLP